MLHDPMRDHPVNSLAGLRAWLARQDPNRTYEWHRADGCLVGRYLADRLGATAGSSEGVQYSRAAERYVDFVAEALRYVDFVAEAFARIELAPPVSVMAFGALKPHTYGAALERLDAQYPELVPA